MARKTNSKPRATTSALQSALSASLALLDRPAAPPSSYRIAWGYENGRSVIAKETPRSLELQAVRWQHLIETVEALGEAAGAVHDWRDTHTLTHGSVGLAVVADRLASLVTTLQEHVGTMEDLSPTLRAAMRQIEARKAKNGGAS